MLELALNHLGGLKATHKILKAAKLYELNNGDRVLLRTSRFLADKMFKAYSFYGLQKAIVDDVDDIDYLVLVRSNEGIYKLPFTLVCELCEKSLFVDKSEGYKLTIALVNNEWKLVRLRNSLLINIDDYFSPFNATSAVVYADELSDDLFEFIEGDKKSVYINVYERDPKARQACINEYGAVCCICGFDFGKIYGSEFDGKIHVHHLKAISKCGGKYTVDPINDLRPVCPNCHMVLHSKSDGVYTIDEVREMLL
jgi:hypothetical protein